MGSMSIIDGADIYEDFIIEWSAHEKYLEGKDLGEIRVQKDQTE